MPTPPRTRYLVDDVEDFLSDLRSFDDDFSRRLHLAEHYPHIPSNFWKRCTPTMVLAMDPEQLIEAIGYPDPTGEKASRQVDRAREEAA